GAVPARDRRRPGAPRRILRGPRRRPAREAGPALPWPRRRRLRRVPAIGDVLRHDRHHRARRARWARVLPRLARALRRRRGAERRVLRRPRGRAAARAVRVLQAARGDRRGGDPPEGPGAMTIRVAAVQHDTVWEDPEANFARLAPMIAGAATAGAQLVVLTEMYATGFSMDADRIAEPFDGPSASFLVEQARLHQVWVCGSV